MLVPAIAFSSWLVSLPMEVRHSTPVARPNLENAVSESASSDDTADPRASQAGPAATDDEVAAEPTHERVLYRGPITPEIARVARTFLDLPMGAEREATVEGHHFVFVLQRHYHPPGFVGAPTGWHKGVTVFEER